MWKLVDAPIHVNIVGYKWVFKVKKDVVGNIFCYKACLVTQEFSQVLDIDYFDTYTPITQISSIYTILAITAAQDMEIHQINIKKVYLNGKLTDNKVIHMR